MRTNINVQEMTVRALLAKIREHFYRATMFDPHPSAELNLDQIYAMVEELIAENGDWMPDWLQA